MNMKTSTIIIGTSLAIAVVILAIGCQSNASAVYSQEQVAKGLSDAVANGIVSQAQAAEIGKAIAVAETGFPWKEVMQGALSAGSALLLGYFGIKKADNKHIIGAEESQALAALVASQKKA